MIVDRGKGEAMTDYHVIGDIHGQAEKLEALLKHLGYYEQDGVYQHKNAKVIFLGDFIDRGRHQRRVIDIVRPMIDRGHALAVIGNHEFNAICYHTLHPETADPLRSHSEKNTKQHKAFLKDYALHDEETKALINWFKKLPIYLEVKDAKADMVLFRVIHACWSPPVVERTPQYLTDEYLIEAAREGTPAYDDIEVLLKGPEIELPEGASFHDKSGIERKAIRVKWWASSDNSTYLDVAMVPDGEEDKIPCVPIPTVKNEHIYPEDAPPVFFGHYWLTGKPRIIRNNMACLDYSAGMDGDLVAYCWDSGDGQLMTRNFDYTLS